MKRRALLVTVVVGLAAGCAHPDTAKPYKELAEQTEATRGTHEAVPVQPVEAYRLVATAGARTAEVIHSDGGVWEPGAGANTNSAGLIAEGEYLFFPLLGYRRITVDVNDPQFGLVDSTLSLVIETRTSKKYQVVIGGPNPNGGGYYAAVSGDPFVYLVIPTLYDYATAIAQGERVVRPPDPKFAEALAKLEETGDPETVTNPWLAQVLESSADS